MPLVCGTGLVGAAVAIHGGIMLETTQMNRIPELDRKNLTVTVEPGVLLMDLAQYVEENGLLYPPDPGEKSATIGGNISTNAGDERKQSVWSARGAFLEAIKASTTEMDECDVVVPRDRVADFIKYTHEVARELQIRIPSFGHAGDGNLHVYLCRDDLPETEWQEKLAAGFAKMYERAREYGGAVSVEHGIGYARKLYLREQLGDVQMGLMSRIRLSEASCL